MTIVEMNDLRKTVKRGERLLGLDLGSKTIGLAISDSGFMIASPLETIQRKKFTSDALALKAIIDERQIGGLVLGLPKNMDGSDGPRVQSTRQFAANLLERFDIPIAFWDERLSTMAVERVLVNEADMSRRKRSAVVDKMAASYILQGALDLMASQNN
ncbi:MAG: Holliday junction resolvase RuvX [Alphaproteobacteria bacterium]|jgi:putative holliday junction resolvase|nr:Holliday junction resolvase RuvX [Alphaproteobacteria bacterium]